LAVGVDTLKVTYSGDTNYATTTNSSTTVTVTGMTASVTAIPSATTINSNQTLTVTGTVSGTSGTPTGTVTLTGGGYTSPATMLSGTGSYSITVPYNALASAASLGRLDTLTVTYNGNSTYDAGAFGQTSVTVIYFAVLTPTVTVIPVSNTLDSGQTLNVTVQVTGSGVTPTGTVTLIGGTFNSGAQTLGTAGCAAGSCVTITIPANSLGAPTAQLIANYSGDANYASGTGQTSVTVTASAFTLAATPPASISPGATATSTITVSSSSSYSGTVTLSCVLTSPTNLAEPPTCAATSGSSTVTMTSGTASGPGSVTVSTSPATAALVYPKLPGKGRGLFGAGSGALLAMLLFLGIPARRRSWRSMLGILVLMAALGSLAACGGGSSGGSTTSNPGTTAGTYTFTVTGTGNPTVTPAPTTTFTVTVN
jgi:hypothetical protein